MLLYPGITPEMIPEGTADGKRVKPDPLSRARYYQSLLDGGVAKNRADLARYLGVSRARVTQVLRRLKNNQGDREHG